MATSESYPRYPSQGATEPDAREREAVLEVRPKDGGAATWHRLEGNRVVVGRDPSVGVRLNNEKVSRYHAEFVRSSDGVWWIHDLNSTNGIRVNGRQVTEKIVSAGDAVEVGDVWLVLRLPGAAKRPPAKQTMPPASRSKVSARRRQQGEAVARQSMLTHRLIRELQHAEAVERRRELICEHLAGDDFAHGYVWVARFDGDEVQVAHGRRPGGDRELAAHEREQLALSGESLRRELTRTQPVVELAGEAGTSPTIACVLSEQDGTQELLCVRPRPASDGPQLRQLLLEVAEGEQQAAEMWAMRHHIRRNAVADYELSMATQIQQSLVPKHRSFGKLELEFGFQPCRSVGGDYVDALRMKDGRVLLGVADVCGKGLQASLVASSLHTLVHVLSEVSADLATLVQRINRHLVKYLPDHSFVTAVFVAVDAQRGELECLSAGHPPSFIFDAKGGVHELRAGENLALGMVEFEPQVEVLSFGGDETLLMYTDGLSEATDPEGAILGVEQLSQRCGALIESAPGADLATLSRRLRQSIAAYQGGLTPTDDVAFLLARFQPQRSVHAKPTLPVRQALGAAPSQAWCPLEDQR